jgi:chromate transporter
MNQPEHPGQPQSPPALATGAREPLLTLFLRFLRFGCLAFGGPAAQIAMIRHELVDQLRWIDSAKFNRALAVYQALPGPEAHELCVYMGTIARGRIGGLLAGLGFMLPGLVLMLGLSWLYVRGVLTGAPLLAAAFAGCQAAVVALIVRAVHRIGSHALTHPWLWPIAGLSFAGAFLGVPFLLPLILGGLLFPLLKRERYLLAAALAMIGLAAIVQVPMSPVAPTPGVPRVVVADSTTADASPAATAAPAPNELELFGVGLEAGLLTFGGAYTVLPFLERDAVTGPQAWMSSSQFLDGVALVGVLPTPLVMIGAFVGFHAQGFLGALVLVFGIFLPAFAFTLIGHVWMEKLIEHRGLHAFLDGITAGVVGIIAATALRFAVSTLFAPVPALIAATALVALFATRNKYAAPIVLLCAAVLGMLFMKSAAA